MFWWLLFGGIALFAVVVFARIGIMLWRKLMALFQELDAAQQRVGDAMAAAENAGASRDGGTEGHATAGRNGRI